MPRENVFCFLYSLSQIANQHQLYPSILHVVLCAKCYWQFDSVFIFYAFGHHIMQVTEINHHCRWTKNCQSDDAMAMPRARPSADIQWSVVITQSIFSKIFITIYRSWGRDTKFHSPRPIFYLPSSKCTQIGERVSGSFPHFIYIAPFYISTWLCVFNLLAWVKLGSTENKGANLLTSSTFQWDLNMSTSKISLISDGFNRRT